MKPRNLLISLFLLSTILSVAFFFYLLKVETTHKPIPILGQVADFRLSDTQGKDLSLTDLKGRVWIADFIFTTCSGICPVMTKNMAQLHRSFLLVDDIKLVSFTVNPETDSPAVLNTYAGKFKADTNRWHFLTGPRETIEDLAINSFKMGSVEEPVMHSGRFVLVDRRSRIRGYYEGTDSEDIQRLFKDTARLIKEHD